jgi:outer membrane protein assembly factor BamB
MNSRLTPRETVMPHCSARQTSIVSRACRFVGCRRGRIFRDGLAATVRQITCAIVGLALASSVTHAGDWPQILGPARDGQAVDESLADSWPKSGPAQRWQVAVGSGLAGVAVQGDRVLVFDRQAANERLSALDRNTGKPLWAQTTATRFQAQIVDDNGPRCVPTVAGEYVVTLGAEGLLVARSLKDGSLKWKRELMKEFRAPSGYFGIGSSPIVIQNRVIVNVGAGKGAGIVAFDLATGKTLWSIGDDQASYAAPATYLRQNQPQLLMVTRLNAVGVDPQTGKEWLRIPFGARGPTVNGATPLVIGQRMLLTASYGIGAKLIELESQPGTPVWEGEEISSQYATPVLVDGQVYAVDGRQDGGPVTLLCWSPESRTVSWREPLDTYATLIASQQKLLVVQTDGVVRLVAAQPQSYRELARATLLPGTTRALPALAHGTLFVRNDRTLGAFELTSNR